MRRRGRSARRIGLRSEAEVGEGALALPIADQPRHLAITDVEQFRPLLPDFQSARLAAPTEVAEHENALNVKLTKLVRHGVKRLPGADLTPPGFCHLGQSLPGAGIG